jgi:hypothetical protein
MKPVIETAMVAPWQGVHHTKVARYLVDWTGPEPRSVTGVARPGAGQGAPLRVSPHSPDRTWHHPDPSELNVCRERPTGIEPA